VGGETDRYNYHAHSDNNDAGLSSNNLASIPYLNQLGAEGGGLYELDTAAGDTITPTNWACPGSGFTCSSACTNNPHPWSAATTTTRQTIVTLRRRYNVYAGGVRQYAALAGPAVGVTCVATATTTWNITNIQLLY
jgi:hypothetical protein